MKRAVQVSIVWLVCASPLFALAHTRWFAPEALPAQHTTEQVFYYYLLCIVAAILAVALGTYLHQHGVWRMTWLKPTASHSYERAAATFAMVTGSFLIIAGAHNYVFSPNLVATGSIAEALVSTQIAIGIAFLLGIVTRTAALALLGLWTATWYMFGTISAGENIWVVGTGLFVAIMGNDYFSLVGRSFFKKLFEPFKPYALSVLRIGTGMTFLFLGFSEKILAPEFGMYFLSQYHWNFMQTIGLPYSDYLFIISAGTVEAVLGIMFIIGALTRLNALVALALFIIPMFFLGPIELTGHVPHLAAITLLLFFGNGGHFLFVKKYKDTLWAE